MVEKSHTAGEAAEFWPSLYEPLRGMGRRIADFFAPQSEASASENEYEITIELPGVEQKDIDVSVHENVLTVKGEKRLAREETTRTYFFSERAYGAFQRSFRLPSDADASRISADFKDGVLTIRIKKAGPPPETSRRIEVRSV